MTKKAIIRVRISESGIMTSLTQQRTDDGPVEWYRGNPSRLFRDGIFLFLNSKELFL